MQLWPRLWILALLGYLVLGRSFAYLGVHSLNLFFGELLLGSFLVLGAWAVWGTWLRWLLGPVPCQLFLLGWALAIFLGYGMAEALRGLILGHDPALTLEDLVFNIYPLFLFLGLYVGRRTPFLMQKAIRWLAWLNGVYGTLYMLFLSRLDLNLPWAFDVPVFGQPGGSAVALLGLLALEPRLGRVWLLLALNFLVLLGIQVRGEWLAFGVGLVVWALTQRRLPRLAFPGLVVLGLFTLMYAVDLHLPAPPSRGGAVSLQVVIARVLAPLNPEAAANLVGEGAYVFAGTIVAWRIPWWVAIWQEVHQDPATALLGLAYGFPLWSLDPLIPAGLRTPHNVFFYSLGYGGWCGAFSFLLFLCALGFALRQSSRREAAGALAFSLWAGLSAGAFFGNFFETPFGAIPFYLLTGYGLAPLVIRRAASGAPHPLPAARR